MWIIAVIWAALGMIGAGLGWVRISTDPQSDALLDQMKQERIFWFWTLASTAVGLLLSFLLFVSALGARSLMPWARKGMILWAILAIVTSLIGVWMNEKYLYPMMAKTMALPPQALSISRATGACFGIVLGVGWPAIVLVYFSRKTVKQPFAEAAAGAKVL
jgi:hypothetical protein